jgi:hypothetical protein
VVVVAINATGFIYYHLIVRDHKYMQKHIYLKLGSDTQKARVLRNGVELSKYYFSEGSSLRIIHILNLCYLDKC